MVSNINNSASYINWGNRPENIQNQVDATFAEISASNISLWTQNGKNSYNLCNINEHKLIKKIIKEAPGDQKEFFILDIGAGCFKWGDTLAHCINSKNNWPENIKIHIIGVRGEKNEENTLENRGYCTIHRLGAFKIEEIASQFKAQGLDLDGKIDFAISSFTLQHLVDPARTLKDVVIDLLRPNSFFLFNSFDTAYTDTQLTTFCLLEDLKMPVLSYETEGRNPEFILQKTISNQYQLAMEYAAIERADSQGNERYKVTYQRTVPERVKNDEELHHIQKHRCASKDKKSLIEIWTNESEELVKKEVFPLSCERNEQLFMPWGDNELLKWLSTNKLLLKSGQRIEPRGVW